MINHDVIRHIPDDNTATLELYGIQAATKMN